MPIFILGFTSKLSVASNNTKLLTCIYKKNKEETTKWLDDLKKDFTPAYYKKQIEAANKNLTDAKIKVKNFPNQGFEKYVKFWENRLKIISYNEKSLKAQIKLCSTSDHIVKMSFIFDANLLKDSDKFNGEMFKSERCGIKKSGIEAVEISHTPNFLTFTQKGKIPFNVNRETLRVDEWAGYKEGFSCTISDYKRKNKI